MNTTQPIQLNIGAGQTYIPGFVNIDISDKADIQLDLSRDRLPFNADSVELVFSYHTLEHVPDYLFALSEIHRVLRHGGRFLVGLPYATLTEYHLVNPYHFHSFNEYSFDFFCPEKLKGSAAETNPIIFNKIFHRFHYIGIFKIIPPPLRTWCRRHLLNVVRKIDYGLISIKNTETGSHANKDSLMKEFQNCLNSRIPYEPVPAVSKTRAGLSVFRRTRSRLNHLHQWWLGK
jgi:SAM-dependent methyltransferase